MNSYLRALDSQSKLDIIADGELEVQETVSTVLIYLIEGSVELTVDAKVYVMEAENIVVVNRYQQFALQKISDNNLFFLFEFSDMLLMQAIDTEGVSFNCNSLETIDQQNFDKLRTQIHRIVEVVLLEEQRANFILFSEVYELLNEMISNFAVYTKYFTEKDTRIRKIVNYIHNHYHEELTLSRISDQFYMEASYFSKFFKKNLGVNFKDYLVNIRLYFAERDLRETDRNIAKIAADNGFSNISSFNQAFKKAHGVTPSDYRVREGIKNETEIEADTDRSAALKRYEKFRTKKRVEPVENSLIQIELRDDTAVIDPVWLELINIGSAEELLSGWVKRQLESVQQTFHFRYVRIWSLFIRSLFIDWQSGTITNYDKLNDIFDYLVDIDVLPWIELNKGLPSDDVSVLKIHAQGKWRKVFSTFIEHIVNRYGLQVVKRWRFEVGLGDSHDEATIEQYQQFFTETKQILKSVSPQIEIGGAGFKVDAYQESDLRKLLERLQPIDYDFYSVMLYPYISTQSREERESQRITDEDYLLNRATRFTKLVRDYSEKPVYINEWNNTVSNRNLINDTLYKGAYVVKNIMDAMAQVAGLGYWSATDWYQTNKQATNALCSGGSGLMNKYGMEKPAMMAFRFLSELTGKHLVGQKDQVLVCKDEEEIIVLVHNYVHPNHLYFLKNESEILPKDIDAFFPQTKKEFRVKLQNIKPGDYEIRTFSCDLENGSLFDRWKELDFAANLRPSDIDYLRNKNAIHMALEKQQIKGNYYTIEKSIDPNGFFIVHLRKETKIIH